MMTVALVAFWVVSAGQEPLLFLSPESVREAEGIELRAQLPLETEVAVAPQTGGSDWYMPVAALPMEAGTGIWYQRVEKAQPEYMDQRVLCLGYYRDGKWTLPSVSEEPVPWGGPNNVVMRRSPHKPTWGGFNQHQIVREGDRYRMVYWDQPAETGEAGAMLAASPDGIRWEKDPRGTVFTEHNDAFTLLPKDGAYLLYQTKLEDWPDKPYADNLDKFRRVQSIRESKDLITWSPQDVFLRPDDKDAPETEFYLMKAFPYGGKYLGILMKYFGDPNAPKKHSSIIRNELMVSDDGRNWQRPFRDTDLGFFSFADPFLDGGRLCFASWKDNGLVLFKYRPDRLVGAASTGEGRFTTPPLGFVQPVADVDASKGWVEVSLVGEDGAVTGTVRREGEQDGPFALPAGAAGSPYRLQVRLHDATIFSIREKR